MNCWLRPSRVVAEFNLATTCRNVGGSSPVSLRRLTVRWPQFVWFDVGVLYDSQMLLNRAHV
jgi:hypothetical protein